MSWQLQARAPAGQMTQALIAARNELFERNPSARSGEEQMAAAIAAAATLAQHPSTGEDGWYVATISGHANPNHEAGADGPDYVSVGVTQTTEPDDSLVEHEGDADEVEASDGPTVKELREQAKAAGVTGYSTMKKDELAAAVAEAEAAQAGAAE